MIGRDAIALVAVDCHLHTSICASHRAKPDKMRLRIQVEFRHG
jgi:hypothetical protein